MQDEIVIGPVPLLTPAGRAQYSIIKTLGDDEFPDDYGFMLGLQPAHDAELQQWWMCGGFPSCSDALRACKELLAEVSR